MKPLLDELRKTLAEKNEEETKIACNQIIKVMGPWAGNPEAVPRYYSPIERDTPNPKSVLELWKKIDRRTRPDLLWNTVPDGDPSQMKNGLRFAGRPVISYAILLKSKTGQQKEYLKLVREGADYLMKTQRKDGLFPFPDLRSSHRLFGPMVEKLLKQKPDSLVDGWIVNDLNGDLQYDNGICGVAMIEAYEVTKDKKYLESANRASNWALKQPLCINWNYNAFSVWLLGRYARASGQQDYLDAALDKLKVGVLPGQMKNGRWFDPHNAKLVYHAIIVRGMLEVYLALDEDHEFRKTLAKKLVLAIDNAADQILKKGASSNSTSTEILSNALMIMGPNSKWEEALNININASLRVVKDRRAPNAGLYLPYYIQYLNMSNKIR